ncbi:g6010 [Coccomyxa elongata]
MDVLTQLLYSETVVGELSSFVLADLKALPFSESFSGNTSSASTTALVVLSPLLKDYAEGVALAFESVTSEGILSDALIASSSPINAPTTALLKSTFTQGTYTHLKSISVETGYMAVPPTDEDIFDAEMRVIEHSFDQLPVLPTNGPLDDDALAAVPGSAAVSSINVTVQSVQKTAETATLQYIADVQAQLAAVNAVNASALSADAAIRRENDLARLASLLKDEKAFLTTVRTYLPSPQQDPDGDGYVEEDLTVPLTNGRRLLQQPSQQSTAAALKKVSDEITDGLQKIINEKLTQKFAEEALRALAKGVVSGLLSKIPVPIVGEVLGSVFSTLIDPPPGECNIDCTWDALKSRAKDLVRGLLRVEYQANLQGELRAIQSRYQSVKTYDRLTSCAAGGAATRKEQYGVRVTALNEVLVGAEGRYLPQVHQANPDFSKDAAAYLDFLVGMGTLRLLLLAQSALNFEATYCSPPPEALAANNLQSLSNAAKNYALAVAAVRQTARHQRRQGVSFSPAYCGRCNRIGADLNINYFDFDVSIEVRDPFVNDGSPTRLFADCAPLRKSNIFEPRDVVFERECARIQRENIQSVINRQQMLYDAYDKQLDEFLKPSLLWRQAFDPFATN